MVLNHKYRGELEFKYRQCADELLKEIIISTYRHSKNTKRIEGNIYITLQEEAERLGFIINTSKTKYMQLTKKTSTIKHDFEVSGKSYETEDRFI
jgi:hypothetical protein